MIFPTKIHEIAKVYNQAYVLIEVNDIGDQVAHALQYDMEYDNMMMAAMRGRSGQILGGGFSGGKAQLGVRTTKAVKRIGCSLFKTMVESEKIVIPDYDMVNEMSTFIKHGHSFQADEGCNDDLVMCGVLFAWATGQQYFTELTVIDMKKQMIRDQQDQLEQDMAPFGFIDDGLDDPFGETLVDEYGTKWSSVVRTKDSDW